MFTNSIVSIRRSPSRTPSAPLIDAQTAGKIRHIGLSEVTPEQIEAAQKIVPTASVQNRYNLFDRKSEATLRFCERNGIAMLPWYPMGGSAGTSIAGKTASSSSGTNHPLADFAREHNASPNQVALAWLLHASPVILPIPGTASIAHLEENVAAASLNITDDEWDALELIIDTQAS